jgi:hypothetical protein
MLRCAKRPPVVAGLVPAAARGRGAASLRDASGHRCRGYAGCDAGAVIADRRADSGLKLRADQGGLGNGDLAAATGLAALALRGEIEPALRQ